MRSDLKAMLSAQGLATEMNNLIAAYSGELHVFAHSMGNVVVSEALRQGGQAKTYVACQAASVARAYDANGPERLDSQRLTSALTGKIGIEGFSVGDIAAAISELDEHPDVFAEYPLGGGVYYSGIRPSAITIVNHHNRVDDALAWWLAGQARKPNSDYYYDYDESRWYLDDSTFTNPVDTALFFPADTFEIFARAAEPDSVPLGASVPDGQNIGGVFDLTGEISGGRNLREEYDFQDGPEDHSAQFRSTIQRRWDYWAGLIADFGITP
jgi:hypothetical protein